MDFLPPFCLMQSLNDAQYVPGYGAAKSKCVQALQKNSVESYQACTTDRSLDFIWDYVFALQVLQNIEYGEKHYVD